MQLLKNIWSTFKKPILLLAGIFLIFVIAGKIVPAISEVKSNREPVTSITATNDKVYSQGQEIAPEDFQVTAVHEGGGKTDISSDDIKLSVTEPAKTGPVTEVTVKYQNFSCQVDVQNSREKLVGFPCGSPNVNDVTAVLYSNGELSFEGEGDVLAYSDGEYPWKDYEGMDDNPIISVTFEDTVTPVSLDDYFSDIETLQYVENIPNTVESMARTFSGCIALEETPDIEKCEKLLNLTETYAGCEGIEKVTAIPSSVRNTDGMCSDCIKLQKGADVSGASGIVSAASMYEGCVMLTEAEVPPSAVDLTSMFSDCINMRNMPEIPDAAENLSRCFSGDISLTTLARIPANVKDVSSCFDGCEKITGVLTVDGNPENYSGFLRGSAVATTVDLQGSSKILDVLANTSEENRNITVNGDTPDPDASYRELMGL